MPRPLGHLGQVGGGAARLYALVGSPRTAATSLRSVLIMSSYVRVDWMEI